MCRAGVDIRCTGGLRASYARRVDPFVLACAAVSVTAVLYGLVGALRRRTARRQRRALDRWAAVLVDPYQAAVARWWPQDEIQAAAARLVLDGLVTVNHRGNLSPTPAAADPARAPGHPLPEALLAALLRRTAPATLGSLEVRDEEFRSAREEFRAARPLLLKVPEPGLPATAGLYLVCAEMLLLLTGVMSLRPDGDAEWAAAWVSWAALIAQVIWFRTHDRARGTRWNADAALAEDARYGTHPALAALDGHDPEAVRRLGVSRMRTRRSRNRGRPRRPRDRATGGAGAVAGLSSG